MNNIFYSNWITYHLSFIYIFYHQWCTQLIVTRRCSTPPQGVGFVRGSPGVRAPSFEPDPSPVDPEAIALLPRRHREIIVFMAVLLLLLLSLHGWRSWDKNMHKNKWESYCGRMSENATVEKGQLCRSYCNQRPYNSSSTLVVVGPS